MRTFIALDIPEKIKKIIEKIQEELPSFIGKKTELENLHLTLKFLGEIDEKKVELLKEKLSKINFKKFEASLGEIGVFNENFIRIVWIKIENCDELQKIIDENLEDLFEKEKRFMSHLTIARVKNVKNKNEFLKKLKEIKLEKEKFLVDKFYLKESILKKEGPVYKNLAEFYLN